MIPLETIVFRQLEMIHKIVADETWLEGERRRCEVLPNDPIVRDNVCRVILRVGQHMRDSVTNAEQLRAATPICPAPQREPHRTAA